MSHAACNKRRLGRAPATILSVLFLGFGCHSCAALGATPSVRAPSVLHLRPEAGKLDGMSVRRAIVSLYPELRAYACSLTGEKARGEDLVGDAIVRALSRKGIPATPDGLRPWLFRVMRNLQIDHWRAERVRRDYACAQVEPEGGGQHAGQGAREAEDDVLGQIAFARLSPEHREILILVDLLGHSYDDAARLLAIPRGTVMSRLSRARASMVARVRGQAKETSTPS